MQALITSSAGRSARHLACLGRSSPLFSTNAPASLRSSLSGQKVSERTLALTASQPRSYNTWSSNSTRIANDSIMNRIGLRTPVQSTCTSNRLPLKSVSTRFTSTSAPRSSATATATTSASANATATTTTATTAVTSAAKTLSHHEEMTKVKFSYNWWKEWTIIMTVFAITGSSSVYFVKPILKNVLKLEGSMQEGPWSYRLTYVCTTMPTYSITLLAVASLFGRRPYFQKVVLRMWSRFLPKKVLQRFQ